MLIKLKRGFDLPIMGVPEQVIHPAPPLRSVALMGAVLRLLQSGYVRFYAYTFVVGVAAFVIYLTVAN